MADLNEIRYTDGKLPKYAWPGGYPVMYLAKDNGVLCADCANDYTADRDNEDQLKPVAYDVYYEGPTIQCEHCNADIESAYGDPEALAREDAMTTIEHAIKYVESQTNADNGNDQFDAAHILIEAHQAIGPCGQIPSWER